MPTVHRVIFSGFILAGLTAAIAPDASAFQAERPPSRFDALVVADPSLALDAATQTPEELPVGDPTRSGWEEFRTTYGGGWSIHIDRRSGAPLLVEGHGIPWIPGTGNALPPGAPSTLESLEGSLRRFLAGHRSLFFADDAELVLNRAASGPMTPETWQVVFDRVVGGIPVSGERYLFVIGHGNLIAFGAPRWSPALASVQPLIDEAEGLSRLEAYMKLSPVTRRDLLRGGDLLYVPLRAPGTEGPYRGPMAAGYASTLVRVYALRVEGEPGTWVGYVDARDGSIRALFDDNRYARVKGGVYPVSNDGNCPGGCEQASYPMPFADITGGSPQTASSLGKFDCPGGSATTSLSGPYVTVADACGAASESVTCNADIDLGSGAGTDCAVPAGKSAGDTHAGRTGFYHLNRIAEHGRAWLPSNTWLTQQLVDNVNLNATCNAFWDGVSVNFYKSGGGCNNTGEIAGVFLHEWGHGLDQNDGGGFDNPTEAYADVTALLSTHVSCLGRGFIQVGTCGGYGNTCLTCTGVREADWDQRANHTPSTPSGFVTTYCPINSFGYNGPCGREQHCEGYLGGETMWDLAVRDLPAAGLDAASSWQLADRLWYTSRNGSGGNAYTCSLPTSDGCAVNSWFSKLRAADDDDGNLANGTPHAAAIFQAFSRHALACGLVGDASNQSTSSCPAIGAPTLTATGASSSASLTWTAASNAASYAVLRNDAGCSAGFTSVGTVTAPTSSFTDTGLANGFPVYYRVQAIGVNSACQGALSNCQTVTPQAFVGSIKLDRPVYGCGQFLSVTVTDGNVGSSTTTAKLVSETEPAGQTMTLTETPAGSGTFTGTMPITTLPPANDGKLSVANGNTIVATYVDADDGAGGLNINRQTTAAVDCGIASVSCVGGGGNWSSTSTWSGGVLPGANDTVLIGDGCTVTIDTNATIRSLTVGGGLSGLLQFEPATPRTLTVPGSVTIRTGATLQSAASGTVTTHLLSIGGDLVVDGTLDLSTNANTAGAELRFTGAADTLFRGNGATADIRLLSLNKAAAGSILEIVRAFTVRGAAGTDPVGFLSASPYTGTLKISGSSSYASIVFPAAAYTIPSTGGFWLNNPSFTVTGQAGSATLSGSLRISSGTYNVGTLSGHSLNTSNGAVTTIEGGALTVRGRFGVSTSTNSLAYTQSAGTVTVSTIGNSSANASFDIGTSVNSTFFMSGGSIVVRIPNTTTTGARDFRASPGYGTFTGGTLQLGDASSGTAKNFGIGGPSSSTYSYFPNLVVSNASAGHTVQVVVGPLWGLSATTNSTATLNLGAFDFQLANSLTNNGILTGTTAGARLHFVGPSAQTVSGTGSVTAPLADLVIDNPAGVTLTQTNAITTARVELVRGTLTNSNKVTLGNGGTTSGITQVGTSGLTTAGGSYDVAPTFNAGTGGVQVQYLQEGGSRTTGPEIPVGRSVAGVTINNTNDVTLSGGNLAITSFLTLTNGRFNTSDLNVPTLTTAITSPPSGGTSSWVSGPLAIQVNTATNTSRTFAIGSPWGWRPVVLANFHSNATLQTYTARVFDGSTGGIPFAPLTYLNPVRYFQIQNVANLSSTSTATVQLSYNGAEPIGATATARVGQATVSNGHYTSRGGATASSPTTGISSTAPLNGDEYFVLANEVTPPAPPVNDTCSGAVALALNAPVTGTTQDAHDDYELTGSACFTSQGQLANTVTTAGGRDVVYSFTAPASGRYSFRATTTQATTGDTVVYVASTCPASTFPTPVVVGSCLSAANRRTSTAEEAACQSLTSGQTVYAIVDEVPGSSPSFEIEVTACDPEVSPNGTTGLANPLTCGKEGSLADSTDWDFFKLDAPGSGARLYAMIDGIASNFDDTKLRLTDASNTWEFDDNDGDVAFGSSGNSAVLAGATFPSGQTWLKVSGNGTVEPYRLYSVVQPSLAAATTETEPNDSAATANSAPGNYFKGTIAAIADADYYAFTASAGDLVYLGLDCDSNRDGTALDGVLSLVASDGVTTLASANGSTNVESPTPNPGIGLDATTPQFTGEGLVYRIRSGGTYYAKVTGSPGTNLDYALSISRNCLASSAAELSVPQSPSVNPVNGGSNVTYTVTVTNNGPAVASSVSVTDTIPASMTFVSSSAPGGWSCGAPGGGQVVCTTASMAASSTANLQFTYKANICTGNVVTTHTSTVSSSTFDAVTSNNTSSTLTNITDTGATNLPVGDTVRLSYSAGTATISWTGEVNPPFNVYRGLETSGFPWSYNHTCFATGLTATSTTDSSSLTGGQMRYYLVSRKQPVCQESSLGQASDLSLIPNSSPCP